MAVSNRELCSVKVGDSWTLRQLSRQAKDVFNAALHREPLASPSTAVLSCL